MTTQPFFNIHFTTQLFKMEQIYSLLCSFTPMVFNLFCKIAPLQALCLKIAPLPIIFLKIVFCFENNSELMKCKRAV